MRRKGKQKKKNTVKGNDMEAFIDVLFDLFSCNHYNNFKKIGLF
jgi:hypothetical protein